jgi:serine protease Do
MIDRNSSSKHIPRRIILLSSAAGLALALLIAGPGGYLPHTMPAWSFAAQAADAQSQPAAGFADLVAKVKSAVISVRVKLDEPQSAVEDEQDQGDSGNGNIEPGSPMEKFFQQYGYGQQHNFHRHHQIIRRTNRSPC